MALTTKKKATKKTKRKKSVKKAKFPDKQGICKSSKKKSTKKKANKAKPKNIQKNTEPKVGYKNPPKEHQFPSGQSGNPSGPPKSKVQLWRYFCNFMAMTDAQLKKLDRKKLTQAQQAALKLVEDMKNGKYTGSQRFAIQVFDREEGRPVEHVVIEPGDVLTDEECEEIREQLLRNHANSNN
jgi:hypothetical protein